MAKNETLSNDPSAHASAWHYEFKHAKEFLKECDRIVGSKIKEKADEKTWRIIVDVPEDFIENLKGYKKTQSRLVEMKKFWEKNRNFVMSVENSKGPEKASATFEQIVPKEMVDKTLQLANHIGGLADAILEHDENEKKLRISK